MKRIDKPKHHYSSGKATNHDKDADEKQAPSLDQAQEVASRGTPGEVHSNESEATNDLNAAMKTAELELDTLELKSLPLPTVTKLTVKKNLVGVGFNTTDQKKKLLWGNKKNTTTEETGYQWDTALFGDRERQEKFNKLMFQRLRLPWCLWPIVGCERRAKGGPQTRQSRRQWPPPCREAEGTSAGLGEAIYCWTEAKRWPNCRFRSLSTDIESYHGTKAMISDILLYCSRILIPQILCLWHAGEYLCSYKIFRNLTNDILTFFCLAALTVLPFCLLRNNESKSIFSPLK